MSKRAWKPPLLVLILLVTGILSNAVTRVSATRPAAPLWQNNETEPNDTPAEADVIQVNQSLAGTVPSTNPSDIDYYVLSADIGRDYEVTLSESPPDSDYQFEIALYDRDGNWLQSEDTTGGSATLSWTASQDTYYFSVEAIDIDLEDAPYDIRVIRFGLTPTATSRPSWDDCEINDTLTGSWSNSIPPGGPCAISVGSTVSDLNFVPYTGQSSPNPDYFLVSVKAGRNYRLETEVAAGVDTVVYLYPPSATDDSQYIASNDDAPGLGLGSRIEWTPPQDSAYVIKIENRDPLPHESDETYTLTVEDISPTPTPTHTPIVDTPTTTAEATSPVIPGSPDIFEPNFSFERASLIGLDIKYTNLNFVPWAGTEADNDFYKLWVVPGKLYTCETSDLGTATNTNVIFCSGPSWEQCFAGNDNVEPFDPNDPYRSRLKFFSNYDGYLYLVIGQVGADRILPEEWKNLSYSLRCYIGLPGTATPTPTGQFVPTATPQATSPPDATSPPPATATLQPSPTPVRIEVAPMTTPVPPAPPTPAATPTPSLYTVQVMLYYDQNENGQSDSGEGISAALVRAYDALSGELLSIDYTDETGYLRFVVPTEGPVRVSVPFFGFNQVVTSTDANIQIRISPHS